ncbi:MAG: DUF6702 family protein [Bacteroidota bacterium]
MNGLSLPIDPTHAIYIGVISIEQESGTDAEMARMEIKVFSDDLEDAIANFSGKRLSVDTKQACESTQIALQTYFSQHLNLRINGLEHSINWDSCEIVGDTHRIHLSFPAIPKWEQIEIQASFFLELFPTQTNIIKIVYDGKKRFGKLSGNSTTFSTSFTSE